MLVESRTCHWNMVRDILLSDAEPLQGRAGLPAKNRVLTYGFIFEHYRYIV
jgi:hypothetical protein